MPDEELDPEAAVVVLRELDRLCAFESGEEDQHDLKQQVSHRSLDNYGYTRSLMVEEQERAREFSERPRSEEGDSSEDEMMHAAELGLE